MTWYPRWKPTYPPKVDGRKDELSFQNGLFAVDIRSFSGRGGRCFRIFGWFLSGNHPEKKHSLNLKALKLSVQLGRATILTLCGAGCWNSWCSCRKNRIRWYGLWMICGLAKRSGVERTLRLHSKQMVVVGNSFLKMTQQFWFGSTNSKNYPTYNLISWICHLICNPIWYILVYIFTYRRKMAIFKGKWFGFPVPWIRHGNWTSLIPDIFFRRKDAKYPTGEP